MATGENNVNGTFDNRLNRGKLRGATLGSISLEKISSTKFQTYIFNALLGTNIAHSLPIDRIRLSQPTFNELEAFLL